MTLYPEHAMTLERDFDLRRFSLANLTVGRIPQTELIEAAAEAGFGAVGLLIMTATPQPLEHELIGNPAAIRETKAALRSNGIRAFDIEAFVLSPDTDLARFRTAMALGAELGATHLSAIGTQWPAGFPAAGAQPSSGSTGLSAGDAQPSSSMSLSAAGMQSSSGTGLSTADTQPSPGAGLLGDEQRVELFARLCDQAAEFGLTVGVEFMLYRDIRDWRDASRMIEAAGRRNAGLIIDTLHFFRAGSRPSDLDGIPADRIAYAQLSDCVAAAPDIAGLPAEARGARLHPGQGVIPLREIIERLPAGIQMVIETPVESERAWSARERARSAAEHARRFFLRS